MKPALLVGDGLVSIALGHVVAAPRAHFQLALLTFCIQGLHLDREFVHSPVVLLLFTARKTQNVSGRQIADDSCEARAVVAGTINTHGFATTLLSEMFGAAIEAHAHPAGEWFPYRQQELKQRPQIHREGIKDSVGANQDLFGGVTVFVKDRRDAVRDPDNRGLRTWPILSCDTRCVANRTRHVVPIISLSCDD